MSDADNTIDGEVNTEEFNKFKSIIPNYYSPLHGFRKGWEDRTTGKPRPDIYVFDYSDALLNTLPVHWQMWWDDYNRGYDAATDRIYTIEYKMTELALSNYV